MPRLRPQTLHRPYPPRNASQSSPQSFDINDLLRLAPAMHTKYSLVDGKATLSGTSHLSTPSINPMSDVLRRGINERCDRCPIRSPPDSGSTAAVFEVQDLDVSEGRGRLIGPAPRLLTIQWLDLHRGLQDSRCRHAALLRSIDRPLRCRHDRCPVVSRISSVRDLSRTATRKAVSREDTWLARLRRLRLSVPPGAK